ncbi:MAG: hypothetical protein IPH73_14695 [Rhodocyclales bacterium]|nr:hypothetical protein [Rhodocyclales bacterium]
MYALLPNAHPRVVLLADDHPGIARALKVDFVSPLVIMPRSSAAPPSMLALVGDPATLSRRQLDPGASNGGNACRK